MPNTRPPSARVLATAAYDVRPAGCLPHRSLKACETCVSAVETQDCEKLTTLLPVDEGMSTTTRAELRDVLCRLTADGEEQKAINKQALSANDEIQTTYDALQVSQAALVFLNGELTELNGRLEDTLQLQRTTSHDLQNILYSTEVATLFLDRDLNIRFFTPATRSLFRLLPGDIGRPLADLASLVGDSALLRDAQAVLDDPAPCEQEVDAVGRCFLRRVMPYRTDDNGVEGVVITFTDITDRKNIGTALEAAKQNAERANAAKSRFLAAASHDLRQPLQTLALLQGLLADTVESPAAEKLVARLDDTLGAMLGMLNTVLDLNQIDTGVMQANIVPFPIAGLLNRLGTEFAYHAQARELALHVVPCGHSVDSDPRLLEQMIRNLVSNALKYTRQGRVLLGCRVQGQMLSIQVHDTGVGIPEDKLDSIFEEYTQLDNAAHDRSKGLGLGLSIVQRLGALLGHTIGVGSVRGKGSVFTVAVPLTPILAIPKTAIALVPLAPPSTPTTGLLPKKVTGVALPGASTIFIVDDDANVRRTLREILEAEGLHVQDHASSESFLHAYRLDRRACLLIDAYLPGLSGLDLLQRLRGNDDHLPAIMITGQSDVHMAVTAMRAGASDFIEKPVAPAELLASIERALGQSSDSEKLSAWRETAASAVQCLTTRQREVMTMVIAGHPSKNIAADLGISQRTVESHRAQVMHRTGCKSLPALARLALAAAWTGSDHSLVKAGVQAGPPATPVPTWGERRAVVAAALP